MNPLRSMAAQTAARYFLCSTADPENREDSASPRKLLGFEPLHSYLAFRIELAHGFLKLERFHFLANP
jgi:hypothetical protein